jgi:hypothetical protein
MKARTNHVGVRYSGVVFACTVPLGSLNTSTDTPVFSSGQPDASDQAMVRETCAIHDAVC